MADSLPKIPGGFRCVVADPPWEFRDKGSRIAPDQRAKRALGRGYETMDGVAIEALPIGGIVAKDALLFLWTTSVHLLDGTSPSVARAWGFTPKSTIVWVKIARRQPVPVDSRGPRLAIGMGHYVRGAHELVLVCRRGRAQVRRRDVPSVFFAPRGQHSAKPSRFLDLVEGLCTGPRLELFSRGPTRRGWILWGDEAPRGTP